MDELKDELRGTAKRIAPPLGDFIREQREQAQVSVRQLARLAGVSNPYLSQIERGLRKPSAEILQQIAKGLRISTEQLYLHAGILVPDDARTAVVAAVLADPDLTERQKTVLVDIYRSFRRENTTSADPAPDTSDHNNPAHNNPAHNGSNHNSSNQRKRS